MGMWTSYNCTCSLDQRIITLILKDVFNDIIEDDLSPTYRASHILLTQKYAHNARKTYYFLQEKFYSNLFIFNS